MFHVTNGESAADVLRAAGVPGQVISWDDVLHDGPVPAGISFNQLRAVRANFIADSGWASLDEAQRKFVDRDRALESSLRSEEIVLWFEHDLYDQLQLLQLLDWFATCELGSTTLTLVCGTEYLGQSTAERLRERFPARSRVTDQQLELARAAWTAFRSDSPSALQQLMATDTSALPFMTPALRRHLEQFPSTRNGLSRSEHQALEAVAAGASNVADAYAESHHKREDPIFLGDSSFVAYIAAMVRAPTPLLTTSNPAGFRSGATGEAVRKTPLALTNAGRAVLDGRVDHVRLNGIDRWLGGVQLVGTEVAWRWDGRAVSASRKP